jgi:hypothetical protein
MMRTGLFLFAMLLTLLSCSDEHTVSTTPTDRLSFASFEDFNRAYEQLAGMGSSEELEQWASTRSHSTLLHTSDPSIENYSEALKTLLNKDYEFQIGDKVIWFNKGKLYAFSPDQTEELDELKKTPEKCEEYGSITAIPLSTKRDQANGRTSANVGFGGLDARNQKEFDQRFHQRCGGINLPTEGRRKYVHEIFDETIYNGSLAYSKLFLRIKLEYRSGFSWKLAGEQRQTIVYATGTAQVVGSGLPAITYNKFDSRDCYTGNWTIFLASANHGPTYETSPYWAVSMTGWINHSVKGDLIANLWNNTEWQAGAGVLW